MRGFKSNATLMGESLIALMGGGSLDISNIDGSPVKTIMPTTPGIGALIAANGVYLSELDQRCVDLFNTHLTISLAESTARLESPRSMCTPNAGWSYRSDEHGRQQIHSESYGPAVDNLLIDMIENTTEYPVFIISDHAIPSMNGQSYVVAEHRRGSVRVFIDDILNIANMSKVNIMRINSGDSHSSSFGDEYTKTVIKAKGFDQLFEVTTQKL